MPDQDDRLARLEVWLTAFDKRPSDRFAALNTRIDDLSEAWLLDDTNEDITPWRAGQDSETPWGGLDVRDLDRRNQRAVQHLIEVFREDDESVSAHLRRQIELFLRFLKRGQELRSTEPSMGRIEGAPNGV